MRSLPITAATTAEECYARLALLEPEIAWIEGQLADPARIAHYATAALYDEWKQRAVRALDHLKREAAARREWLAGWHMIEGTNEVEDYEAFWRTE